MGINYLNAETYRPLARIYIAYNKKIKPHLSDNLKMHLMWRFDHDWLSS